jgi:modulator of FtsH protease HflK
MAQEYKPKSTIRGKGEAQIALESAFATSFRVLQFVMYGVIIWLFLSGMFAVQQNQKAIVMRFGRLKAVYGPGFHFALPYPIDKVEKVNVDEVKSIELDKTFWHKELVGEARPMPLMPSLEFGYTLTADANIIHSKWALFFKINDPVKYLLRVSNPDSLLLDLLDSSIVEATSEFTVDEATRTNIEELRRTVEWIFSRKLAAIGLDDTFSIQAINAVAIKPPLQTEEAFTAVINAEQERDRRLSEAKGEANKIRNESGGAIAQMLVNAIDAHNASIASGDQAKIKEAEEAVNTLLAQSGGTASQLISKAEAYKKMIVTEADSDAKRMRELAVRYKENPNILITEKLFELYSEVLQDRALYVLGETSAKGGREIRLQINPDPDIEREERQKKFKEELPETK